MNQFNTLKASMRYRGMGLSIIPLPPKSKKPLRSWKQYQETPATEDELSNWFGSGEPNNIGIVTGEISGVVVLDVDEPGALDGFPELPKTPCATTGRGKHYYFKHPGFRIKTTAKIAPGLDVRGDGGLAVAPPSLHSSGKQYEWVVPFDCSALAELPEWIVEAGGLADQPSYDVLAALDEPTDYDPRQATDSSYCAGWFDDVAKLAEMKPKTGRNDRLLELSRNAGNLIAGGFLNDSEAETALYEAARVSGLDHKEVRATMKSGINYGLKLPRERIERVLEEPAQREDVGAFGGLEIINAHTVQKENIDWIWDNVFAKKLVTIVAGTQGYGKSLVAINLASIISRGGKMPGQDEPTTKGKTLFLSQEDLPGLGMVPRLEAANADLRHIKFLTNRRTATGTRLIDLRSDLKFIGSYIEHIRDVELVVVDPIGVFYGGLDQNDNVAVREVTSAMTDFAARHNVAVVLVAHTNKDQTQTGVSRVMGASAWTQAARSVHFVEKTEFSDYDIPTFGKNPERILRTEKNSYGDDQFSHKFSIRTRDIGMEKPVAHAVFDKQELLFATYKTSPREFVLRRLQAGPNKTSDLVAAAKEFGIARSTLDDNLRALECIQTTVGGRPGWKLP